MSNFLIVAIIVFLLAIYFVLKDSDSIGEIFAGFTFVSILSLCSIFIISIILHAIYSKEIVLDTGVDEIVSIGRENNTEGQFFLGSGYVDGEAYYYFYISKGNDSYVLGKAKSEGLLLKETNTKTPSASYRLVNDISFISRWLDGENFGTVDDEYYKHRATKEYEQINIPIGAIIKKFELQ